jgi:hypothetical protein
MRALEIIDIAETKFERLLPMPDDEKDEETDYAMNDSKKWIFKNLDEILIRFGYKCKFCGKLLANEAKCLKSDQLSHWVKKRS